MDKLTPVSEIMTSHVISITQKDSLDVAENLFKKYHIRHIPVVKGSRIVGMLSLTDLLRISFTDEIEDDGDVETIVYDLFTIDQVMTKNLIKVSPQTTIYEVAQILSEKEFHALPIVEKGKLVGIVTTTDLINFLLKQY